MHDKLARPQDRYPGYDVLSKRTSPSWNEQTRRVVNGRLAIGAEPRFFTAEEFKTVDAIAARIVPQPTSRPPVPVAALVDDKLYHGASDGYRVAGMPPGGDAWRLCLKGLETESEAAYGGLFRSLAEALQDSLLLRMESGKLNSPAWGSVHPKDLFKKRMARDIVLAYYAHPTAWSEIGWGGPASPRGYVRLDFDDRDPWEAAEAVGDDHGLVRRINRDVG
jgi:hypothetical protein